MFSSSTKGLLPQVDEGPLRNLDFRNCRSQVDSLAGLIEKWTPFTEFFSVKGRGSS